jgi:hypothetical protein
MRLQTGPYRALEECSSLESTAGVIEREAMVRLQSSGCTERGRVRSSCTLPVRRAGSLPHDAPREASTICVTRL